MRRTIAIRRAVVFTAAPLLLGTAFGSGPVAAHDPAGHQTAGADGHAELIGGSSVGNALGVPHDPGREASESSAPPPR